MATITSTASGNWATGATWVGGTKPADGDTVVIAAGHNILMDENQSGFANGIAGLTITGHATTPAMLYFKNGTSGYLKIKTGNNIAGTNLATYGRILANSDGVWGNTGQLAFANKAIIDLQGTAKIDATYVDLVLYHYTTTNKSVRTYGTKYQFTAGAGTVDVVNNTIDLGVTPPSVDTPVLVTAVGQYGGGALPGGITENVLYYVRGVSGTKCQLSYQPAADLFVDITSVGSGGCCLFTGYASGSATVNVMNDVTGDAAWVTTTDHNRVCLVNSVSYDQQRLTLTTINAGTIVLSAVVDSAQYPGALIELSSRNVSIRSAGTSASQPIIDFVDTNTRSVTNIIGGEVVNTAGSGTTFYGYGVSAGIGHTITGTIMGCNNGIYYGSGHTITGTIMGCNNGTNYGSGHTITGTIMGCNYGINSGSGHTITGTIMGCNYGIYYGSGYTITGTIMGCNIGINFGSGHTITGTIMGCSYGINSGSGHTITGTIMGCSNGINSGSGYTITGTIMGCNYGINYCGFLGIGMSLLNNSTNIRFSGISYSPVIRGRVYKYNGTLNDTRSWSAGGSTDYWNSIYPPGYTYCNRFTFIDPGYWTVLECEISLISKSVLNIPVFAYHDGSGLTSDQRLHFQIVSLAADPLVSVSNVALAEWIAADIATTWQSATLSYTRTSDDLLMLRIMAKRGSGNAYAMFDSNAIQTSYGF